MAIYPNVPNSYEVTSMRIRFMAGISFQIFKYM